MTVYGTRSAGMFLALGALLMLLSGPIHPPHASDPQEWMAIVAAAATRWRIGHTMSMFGLIFLSMGALAVLLAQTQLTARWTALVAWIALATVLPLITLLMVVEAAVIPAVAEAGDLAAFTVWKEFALTGLVNLNLVTFSAMIVLATDQFQRNLGLTPKWAAAGAAGAASLALVGAMIVGLLEIIEAGPLVGVGSLLSFAWLLWSGVSLARLRTSAGAETRPSGRLVAAQYAS